MKKLYITLCTLLALAVGINLQAMEPAKTVEAQTKPSATAKKSKQKADARNKERFGTPDNSAPKSQTVNLNSNKTTAADVNGTPSSTSSQGISLTEEATPLTISAKNQKILSDLSPEEIEDFKNEFHMTYEELFAQYPDFDKASDENFIDKYGDQLTNDMTTNHELVDKFLTDLGLNTLPEPGKTSLKQELYKFIDDLHKYDIINGEWIEKTTAAKTTKPIIENDSTNIDSSNNPNHTNSSISQGEVNAATKLSDETLFSQRESKNETEQAQDKSSRTESRASDQLSSVKTVDYNNEEVPAKVVEEAKKVTDKSSFNNFLDSLSKIFFGKNSENPEVQDAINNAAVDGESQSWWSPWDGSKFQTWYENTMESFKKVKKSLPTVSLFSSRNHVENLNKVNFNYETQTDSTYSKETQSKMHDVWNTDTSEDFGDYLIGTKSPAA